MIARFCVNRRIVIIGGHDSFIKVMREKLPNAKYIAREQRITPDMLRGATEIWVQQNSLIHGSYYKAKKYANSYGIPLRYLAFASAQKCVDQIMRGNNA